MGWGTCQDHPRGLGLVSGVIGTLRNEFSWPLLQALGTPQAPGAPGMGQAVPVGIGVGIGVLGQLWGSRSGSVAEPD